MNSAHEVRGSRKQFLFVNFLTLSRAPLLFAFMFLAIYNEFSHIASLKWVNLLLLVLSSVTDLFDGYLSRKWRVTSKFGAVCDPMMDKVFFIVVFPTLTALLFWHGGEEIIHAIVMLVLTVSYILRDQWVMALRALSAGSGADLRANMTGKIRTASSFPIGCALYAYLAFHWFWLTKPFMIVVEVLAIILNAYSCFVYTKRYSSAITSR